MALAEVSSIMANAVRYVFAILLLLLMGSLNGSVRKIGTFNRQTLKVVAIATVFNIMLGSLIWVESVKFVGASIAAIFYFTAPMFALPVSVLFLGEKFSRKIMLGTFLTILGVWFII